MDPFTRAAVAASLVRLEQGPSALASARASALDRVVRAFARDPNAAWGFVDALMRAAIGQDSQPAVVSTLLDVLCAGVPSRKQAVILSIVSSRATRAGAYEVVLQTALREPRSYDRGTGSEGARIATILAHSLQTKRPRLVHSLLESWFARRDPRDPAIVAFVRTHAASLLATGPTEPTVIALHRIVPSTSTWRALADCLRARRAAGSPAAKRIAGDDA